MRVRDLKKILQKSVESHKRHLTCYREIILLLAEILNDLIVET